MSKEEKKIKELEELGVSLVEDPVNTINRANPTKLRLQALSFIAIAKIEMYFLEKMVSQVKVTDNVEDTNVNILAKKISEFKDSYSRLIAGAKRTLKVPENNTEKLYTRGFAVDKESMADMTKSYSEINNIFSTAKSVFSNMKKPVEHDVEISTAEQDNIKNAVYQALNGVNENNINDKNYQDVVSNVADSAMKKIAKTDVTSKEQKLDDFFNNEEKRTELDDTILRNVLKGGKVVSDDKTSSPVNNSKAVDVSKEVSPENNVSENGYTPIFDENNIFPSSFITTDESKLAKNTSESKTEKSGVIFKPQSMEHKDDLSDKDIGELTNKFIKDKTSIFDTVLKPEMTEIPTTSDKASSLDESTDVEEIIPDVAELKQQLNESVIEIEQNRLDKEKVKSQYNKEKSTRELKQKELSQSRQELEDIKQDIEKKEQEQQSIGKLNNDIEMALKLKKQIEENKRQAAQEAEEARKYQESLEEEKQKQVKVDEEKQDILAEKNRLRAENSKVSSNLQTEKEKLEALRRELQSFSSSNSDGMARNVKESSVSFGTPIKR